MACKKIMNTENLAIIVGGTGSIGSAIADEIKNLGFRDIIKIGRKTNPFIDFNDENSIQQTVDFIKNKKNQFLFYLMQLVFCMIKIIIRCRKRLLKISIWILQKNFLINTIGPSLLIKYFSSLLDLNKDQFLQHYPQKLVQYQIMVMEVGILTELLRLL